MIAERALLIAAALCSCSRPKTIVPIEAEAGDLIIAIAVSDRGQPLEIKQAIYPDPLPLISDARAVAAMVIRAGDLIDLQGRPLSKEALLALEISAGDAPDESCGRCSVLQDSVPQVLLPGDYCPLPEERELELWDVSDDEPFLRDDPSLIDFLRSKLHLSMPGPCACLPPPATTGGRGRELCVLGAEDLKFVPQVASVSGDGVVLALSSGNFAIRRSDGSRQDGTIFPNLRRLSAPASFSASDWFIVPAVDALSSDDRSLLFLSNRGALEVPSFGTTAGDYAAWTAIDDSPWLQVAHGARECRYTDRAECHEVPVSLQSCPQGVSSFRAVTGLSGGDLAAISADGRLLLRPRGSSEWLCSTAPNVPIDSGVYAALAASIGRRIFVCAEPDFTTDLAVFATAEIPPLVVQADGTLSPIVLQWTVHPFPFGFLCTNLFRLPGAVPRMILEMHHAEAFSFDSAGQFLSFHVRGLSEIFPEAPAPISFAQRRAERVVLIDGNRDVWVRSGDSSERVFRAPRPIVEAASAMTTSGGRTLVFQPSGAIGELVPGSSACNLELRALPSTAGQRLDRIDDVAADPVIADRFHLAGIAGGGTVYETIDLGGARARITIEENAALLRVKLQPFADGRVLIVRSDGSISERFSPIDVSSFVWRGETPEEPGQRPKLWLGVSGQGAVAWLLSRRDLVRVIAPVGRPLTAEILHRQPASPLSELVAASADCPNDLLLLTRTAAASFRGGEGLELLPGLEIGAFSGAAGPAGELHLALLRSDSLPVWVFTGARQVAPTIYRSGGLRLTSPTAELTDAEIAADQRLIVLDVDGRIATGDPR